MSTTHSEVLPGVPVGELCDRLGIDSLALSERARTNARSIDVVELARQLATIPMIERQCRGYGFHAGCENLATTIGGWCERCDREREHDNFLATTMPVDADPSEICRRCRRIAPCVDCEDRGSRYL